LHPRIWGREFGILLQVIINITSTLCPALVNEVCLRYLAMKKLVGELV